MADVEHIAIVRHVTMDGIDEAIGSLDPKAHGQKGVDKARAKLTFVRMRYRGWSVVEAADALGINAQTGYNWQMAWNESGLGSLYPAPRTGRPPKLDEAQREALADRIRRGPMTTREARLFIVGRFGVEYSEKQVHVILGSMGFHHSKPYPVDYRRPADAEGQLKKNSRMLWTA